MNGYEVHGPHLYLNDAKLTSPLQTYTLQLRPQSGRDIPPLQQNGVKQEMLLDNVDSGKGNAIKMRFKVSYHVGGQTKEDQGVIPPLGIA